MESTFYFYKKSQSILSDETHKVRTNFLYLLMCVSILLAFQGGEITSVLGIKFSATTVDVNFFIYSSLIPIIYLLLHFNFKVVEDLKIFYSGEPLSKEDIVTLVFDNFEVYKNSDYRKYSVGLEEVTKKFAETNNGNLVKMQMIMQEVDLSSYISSKHLWKSKYSMNERFKKFLNEQGDDKGTDESEDRLIREIENIYKQIRSESDLRDSLNSELHRFMINYDDLLQGVNKRIDEFNELITQNTEYAASLQNNLDLLVIKLDANKIKVNKEIIFLKWIPNVFCIFVILAILNLIFGCF